MFNSFMGALENRAEQWAPGGLKTRTILLIVVGLALSFGSRFIPMQILQVTAGSFGGVIIFIGLYFAWYGVISPERKEKLDFRGRWELPRRRMAAIWFSLGWFAIVIVTGQYLGGPTVGALTVAALLTIWRMASATPEEVKALNEEAEEWAEMQAEARAAELEDAIENGVEPEVPQRRRPWRRS